ncbi:hypothetical protein PSH08_11560 [Enterococcus gallinarum]|uniref:hypothetical protein n=1 Tax=Enterococcus gallinarum TaxID=1353 RepID=UPI002954F69F|nr:hypothetical protein [Enterococcus gallinarum]MDV7823642.1 hypothetical protein [Enterococcus gallinarum]
MSEVEKALTDAYYWLSMYKSGAITEGVAMEKVKEAIFEQPQLNENQQSIEEYVEMAIVQLREANLILNKVYEKDRFAREIQDDISEIMGTLRYRYFGEQEEE